MNQHFHQFCSFYITDPQVGSAHVHGHSLILLSHVFIRTKAMKLKCISGKHQSNKTTAIATRPLTRSNGPVNPCQWIKFYQRALVNCHQMCHLRPKYYN